MSILDQILDGKIDPTETVSKLVQEKNWDLLINSLSQCYYLT